MPSFRLSRKALKIAVFVIFVIGACAIGAYLLFVALPEREKQREEWLRSREDISVQRDLLNEPLSGEIQDDNDVDRAKSYHKKPETRPPQ